MRKAKLHGKADPTPVTSEEYPGWRRYRRLELVLVAVDGWAPDAQVFDELTGQVTPDVWIPLEFGGHTKMQIACRDGEWHDLERDLWEERIAPKGEPFIDGHALHPVDAYSRYALSPMRDMPHDYDPDVAPQTGDEEAV